MVKWLAVLMLFGVVYSAHGQEGSDPNLIFEYQIRWGDGDWESLAIRSLSISQEAIPGSHSYVGVLGLQVFKAVMNPGSVEPAVDVATITFEVSGVSGWWSFYRIRWGVRSAVGTTTADMIWSEASYWVMIVNLGQPGLPVH